MAAEQDGHAQRDALVRSRTDALLARIATARQAVTEAADELASLTRELRLQLADMEGGKNVQS